MNSSAIRASVELLRPLNTGIVFLVIGAAAILAGAHTASWHVVLLASISGALIAAGGYAINDFFDLEIDKINRPMRPLPRGAVSRRWALWLWGTTSAAGILAGAFLGPLTLAIGIFWVISLYFYSRVYKRTILLGNLLVGVVTGLAFVFGAAAVGGVERSVFPAIFAFLVNVARELVKDVEDVEGDSRGGATTLPVKYGAKPTLLLASLVIVLLITTTPLPYSVGLYDIDYLVLVGVVDAALVYIVVSMWRDRSISNLSRVSSILKLSMVAGLVAIFFGS